MFLPVEIHTRYSQKSSASRGLPYAAPNPLQRHYSVLEVAAIWSLSDRTIRRIFGDVPGVVHCGSTISRQKQRCQTLRIPETVLRYVYQLLQMTK